MASSEGRYEQRPFEAYDTHSGSPQPAEAAGRTAAVALYARDRRPRRLSQHRARPRARGWCGPSGDSGRPVDPAGPDCAAAPPLTGLLSELSGMLNQRGEALAARLTAPGSRGVADVSDFLLLQSVNRWQKLLAHWASDGNVHPDRSLCRSGADGRRFRDLHRADAAPDTIRPYRHDDLQRSFAPVVADLRRSLSAVLEQTAIHDPAAGAALRRACRSDHRPRDPARVELRADRCRPTCRPRRCGASFPSQVKIGAVEHIRELVNVALAGHRGAAVAGRAAADSRSTPAPRISSSTATARIGSRCSPPAASRSTSPASSRTSVSNSGRSAADDSD